MQQHSNILNVRGLT